MNIIVRPLFLISLVISLASCGGGATVASGGSGGTGISTGSIGGFGSIFVNGIQFDISSATLVRDGVEVFNEDDFRLGEVVVIEGSINSGNGTGVATSVTYDEILRGPVTATAPLFVMGQPVITLPSTVFNTNLVAACASYTTVEDLSTSDRVEVSGFYNSDNELVATSIKCVENTTIIEAKLIIDSIDLSGTPDTFQANQLTVNYTDLSSFNVDDLVSVVAGSFNPTGPTLTAASINGLVPVMLESGTEVEVEGIVSNFNAGVNPDFRVNELNVLTDASTTYSPDINSLVQNARVEVEGYIDSNGNLLADEIEIKNEDEDNELEVFGEITAKLSAPDRITVQGNEYEITVSSDLHGLDFSDLNIGDWVDIQAFENSGNYIIKELERKSNPGNDEGEIEGTVTDFNSVNGVLIVNGVTVTTDISSVTTTYRGPNENVISSASFFSSIAIGSTEIEADGIFDVMTGEFAASDIQIDD